MKIHGPVRDIVKTLCVASVFFNIGWYSKKNGGQQVVLDLDFIMELLDTNVKPMKY